MSIPGSPATQNEPRIRRLAGVAVIIFAAHAVPSATAGDVAGGQAPEQLAATRTNSAVAYFDSLVFGYAQNALEDAVDRLELHLKSKINRIASDCRLTAVQSEKLLLAGRGDIKHLLDRVLDERKQFDAVTADDDDGGDRGNEKVHEAARRVKLLMSAGPFENGSLFVKVMQRDLTPEQKASLAATDQIRRSGGTISSRFVLEQEAKDVYLTGSEIDDDALARVSRLLDLRLLALERTRVTDAGLAHLLEAKELEGLRLSDTLISDAGLQEVGGLSGLRMLWLAGTRVSDAGLAHLTNIGNLEVLVLDGTRITNAGTTHLQALTHLRWLYLQGTPITDSGVSRLSSLSALERLQLSSTGVTDRGLMDLKNLTNLQELWVAKTAVTEIGIDDLKSALPRLTIYR